MRSCSLKDLGRALDTRKNPREVLATCKDLTKISWTHHGLLQSPTQAPESYFYQELYVVGFILTYINSHLNFL